MNKLQALENNVQNLRSDAAKEMMARMLDAEASHLRGEIVPLNANYQKVRQEEKEDHILEAVAGVALAAGAIALGALAIHKIKTEIDKKAALEKIKLEEERKEMIRKLSQLKGKR